MEEKKEFGYTAKLPREEGKRKKIISSSKPKRESRKTNLKPVDSHEKKLLERTLKNVKLPSSAWMEIKRDFRLGEGKDTICRKYGIKRSYYKHLKKIVMNL
jgi:hypothetical protein